jgi:hypothetical protein
MIIVMNLMGSNTKRRLKGRFYYVHLSLDESPEA